MATVQHLAEQYVATYITPADPLRWAREHCQFPRSRQIWPVNCNNDISSGCRIFHRHGEEILVPLQRITDNRYRGFRCNIERKDDDPRKHWVFLRYADDAMLNFLAVDIDRHHKRGETAAEREAIEQAAWKQVTDIEALGIPGQWTTTPGNVVHGVHYFGLNYNIYFDSPRFLFDMRNSVESLRLALGWKEISTNLDMASGYTRNYRPPGQYMVQIADVHSDHEYIIPITERWDTDFLPQWGERPIIDLALFGEIVDEQEQETTQAGAKKETARAAETGAESSESESRWNMPIVQHAGAGHSRQQWESATPRSPNAVCGPSQQSTFREPERRSRVSSNSGWKPTENAFRRLVGRRNKGDSILSPIVTRYNGDMKHLDKMKAAAKQEFTKRSIPFGFVDHVHNPSRFDVLIDTKLRWFCKNYDPAKAVQQWRLEKDRTDAIRFAPSKALDRHVMLKQIKSFCSYREKAIVSQFWDFACQYDGRVAAKSIYDWNQAKGFCTFGEWRTLRDKLIAHKVLIVAEKHDASRKVCTLWANHPQFITENAERKGTAERIDALMKTREGEEKKEKQYMEVPSRIPFSCEPYPQDAALTGAIDDILSDLGENLIETIEPMSN